MTEEVNEDNAAIVVDDDIAAIDYDTREVNTVTEAKKAPVSNEDIVAETREDEPAVAEEPKGRFQKKIMRRTTGAKGNYFLQVFPTFYKYHKVGILERVSYSEYHIASIIEQVSYRLISGSIRQYQVVSCNIRQYQAISGIIRHYHAVSGSIG